MLVHKRQGDICLFKEAKNAKYEENLTLDTLRESGSMIAVSILESSSNIGNYVPPIDNLPIDLRKQTR